MKKLILLMICFLLVACSNTSEEEQVKQGKENDVQSKQELKKEQKKPVKVDYKKLSEKRLSEYIQKMPDAFNTRDYSKIAPYIKKGSEAEKFIKKKLPTGAYDNYIIYTRKIGTAIVTGQKSKVTVTRRMSSNDTNGQQIDVVTVFDLAYDAKKKTMMIIDFNDKSIKPVNTTQDTPTTEAPTTETPKQPVKGNANQCIMTEFAAGCDGLSDAELDAEYQKLVDNGTLPKARVNDCVQCAIQDSINIKNGKTEPVKPEEPAEKVSSKEQAVSLVKGKYQKSVEDYNDGIKVSFVANPSLEEDVGGKHYRIKAVSPDGELLQSFKVYIASGEVISE